MKMGKKVLFLAALLCLLLGIHVSAKAADKVTMPDRAVRSGNKIYWAIGNDGAGSIYCYNIKTGKNKKVVNLPSKQLSVRGSYLYFAVDNYGGSDASNHYIYRAKTNGKSKKKLAKGMCPVVIGKYIYYIEIQKTKYFGVTVDGSTTGIYRMKLDGSGKKCIYQTTGTESLAYLYKINNQLLFSSNGRWYTITRKGTGKTAFAWSYTQLNGNTNKNLFSEYSQINTLSANSSGYSFRGSGASIIRTSQSGASKTIATLKNKTIYKIIDLDGYLFVIAHGKKLFNGYQENTAYVCVMKSGGKGKKKLTEFVLAGGGW